MFSAAYMCLVELLVQCSVERGARVRRACDIGQLKWSVEEIVKVVCELIEVDERRSPVAKRADKKEDGTPIDDVVACARPEAEGADEEEPAAEDRQCHDDVPHRLDADLAMVGRLAHDFARRIV